MLFFRRDGMADIRRLSGDYDRMLLGPLFRKYASHPPQIVHYTTVEALESIVSSGNLRMTHFRHLNDSTEMQHGRRVVLEVLSKEAQSSRDTSQFFDYCRFLFNEVDDETIQYFVTSFSSLPDSPELWARYGVRGAGVAINFDTSRMGARLTEPAPYYIGAITYTSSEQRELVEPLVEAAKVTVSRYIAKHGYDVQDGAVQLLAAKLCSHLNHHSISLKVHDPWHVEQEWRTVFSLLQNDMPARKARVQFRPDGRPFVDVPVLAVEPDELRMPILSVTAGILADQSRIAAILRRYGYSHVHVGVSVVAEADIPAWPRELGASRSG